MEVSYTPFFSRFAICEVDIRHDSLVCPSVEKGLHLVRAQWGDWGEIMPIEDQKDELWSLPTAIDLRYVTTLNGKCYSLDANLDAQKAEALWAEQQKIYPDAPFNAYVVGTAPYGGVAIWLKGDNRQVLVEWLKAEETQLTPEEKSIFGFMNGTKVLETLYPERQLQSDMEQYHYRFVPLEERWTLEGWLPYNDEDYYYDGLDLIQIAVQCTDGTFYKQPDNAMAEYHIAGKPQKVKVAWEDGKSSYSAYFWLNNKYITELFSEYLGKDSQRADILLRIDTREGHYQFALLKEGESKPRFLPWFAYQLLIFRDRRQYYRSPNYNQPDGAWIW